MLSERKVSSNKLALSITINHYYTLLILAAAEIHAIMFYVFLCPQGQSYS